MKFTDVMPRKTFRDRFSRMVWDTGKTCKSLADECGIARSTFLAYMNYGREPTVSNLVKICTYFNCSADWLIGLTDKRR